MNKKLSLTGSTLIVSKTPSSQLKSLNYTKQGLSAVQTIVLLYSNDRSPWLKRSFALAQMVEHNFYDLKLSKKKGYKLWLHKMKKD